MNKVIEIKVMRGVENETLGWCEFIDVKGFV